MSCPPEPRDTSPARAELAELGAAIRTSTLPPVARLMLWTAADLAAEAADAGHPFAISIEELSEQSGVTVGQVARSISMLAETGWIARKDAGWLPTVPAPRTGQ